MENNASGGDERLEKIKFPFYFFYYGIMIALIIIHQSMMYSLPYNELRECKNLLETASVQEIRGCIVKQSEQILVFRQISYWLIWIMFMYLIGLPIFIKFFWLKRNKYE